MLLGHLVYYLYSQHHEVRRATKNSPVNLKEYDGQKITVSHDRWFLDQVCDTIWELPGDGSLKMWPSNYSEYIRRKSGNC